MDCTNSSGRQERQTGTGTDIRINDGKSETSFSGKGDSFHENYNQHT